MRGDVTGGTKLGPSSFGHRGIRKTTRWKLADDGSWVEEEDVEMSVCAQLCDPKVYSDPGRVRTLNSDLSSFGYFYR